MKKVCKYCGAELNENAKFCPKCGKKIEEQEFEKEKIDLSSNIPVKKYYPFLIGAIFLFIIALVLVLSISLHSSKETSEERKYAQTTMGESSTENSLVAVPSTTAKNNSTDSKNVGANASAHRYKFIVADVTWKEAYRKCKEMGGYLARLETDSEFQQIVDLIKKGGFENKKFFIAGRRPAESKSYYWIDSSGSYIGAPINSTSHWIPGDPSYYDGDVEENYMMLYFYNKGGYWAWADVPNDVLSTAPDYKNKIGYICEFEN